MQVCGIYYVPRQSSTRKFLVFAKFNGARAITKESPRNWRTRYDISVDVGIRTIIWLSWGRRKTAGRIGWIFEMLGRWDGT